MDEAGGIRDQGPPRVSPNPERPTAWCVLDTDFGDGQAFFESWHAWRTRPDAPRVLHYLALCQHPVASAKLIGHCQQNPSLQPLAHSLAQQWFGLLPGFHRFLLDGGRVILSLGVGSVLALLRQQQFVADEVKLTWKANSGQPADELTSLWSVKALARCCRRDTALIIDRSLVHGRPELILHLQQCGFFLEPVDPDAPAAGPLNARYNPAWTVKTSRQTGVAMVLPVQRCAVIGAGLAGASVASTLARRGWQVRVLDQAAVPASGASGLPVGLVVPHVSSDDCALSRLSRAGVRLVLQQAKEHLQEGQQWCPSGVLEHQVDGTPQLPATWPPEGHAWSAPGSNQADAHWDGPALWHTPGAWVRPAELVNAWLRQPGVTFQGNAKVTAMFRHQGVWSLMNEAGEVLCCAERVVFANAAGVWPLLRSLATNLPELTRTLSRLPDMQGMRGLLTWGWHAATPELNQSFPPFPVNGCGSVIAQIPLPGGRAWFAGSSYQPEQQVERSDHDNHARNLASLQKLMPGLATALAPSLANGNLFAWKGIRCVTSDRLPVVGALEQCDQPSLWICAGLASRGLSLSMLCAELLAAQWGSEPLPVEASLARSLKALRA